MTFTSAFQQIFTEIPIFDEFQILSTENLPILKKVVLISKKKIIVCRKETVFVCSKFPGNHKILRRIRMKSVHIVHMWEGWDIGRQTHMCDSMFHVDNILIFV